jgi:nucleoside-diphosphate-sugar epimerase
MSAPLALITGGSGYFGSLLRDRLLAAGQPVRVLDLQDTPDRPAAVAFVQGDIRDPQAVAAACAHCDVVYHCVAQVPLAKDRALFQPSTSRARHPVAAPKRRRCAKS